jgi:hypothetical protein
LEDSGDRRPDTDRESIMTVRHVRSALAKPGKGPEAAAFAGRVCQYLAGMGIEVQWGMEVGGEFSTIVWFSDTDDMATVEAQLGKMMADTGYNELVNGAAADLFVPGKVRDRLFMLM